MLIVVVYCVVNLRNTKNKRKKCDTELRLPETLAVLQFEGEERWRVRTQCERRRATLRVASVLSCCVFSCGDGGSLTERNRGYRSCTGTVSPRCGFSCVW